MNWNTMCADYHLINLRQNYIAEADSFHISWDVIDVSCEACHGPGGDHVEFVSSPEGGEASGERIREDLNLTRNTSQIDEINTCAPCHSLLCLSCHESEYNNPENYFHEPNTEVSQCINCYMTERVYMGNDYHRDHSFRVLRPDQGKQFGTRNACNNCHGDRLVEWAVDTVD